MLQRKESELRMLQRTHDEFVKSSGEYEKELELEVDRYEKQTRELQQTVSALEQVKLQLQQAVNGLKHETEHIRERESAVRTQLEEMKWKVQALEQANDELETAQRIAQATIDELQHKLDCTVEQNVFLQHEKEEAIKLVASFRVAEVHPVSSKLRKASSDGTVMKQMSIGNNTRRRNSSVTRRAKKGRYPEVVETCLHITCQKCQEGRVHSTLEHHHGRACAKGPEKADELVALGFFERLRLRWFRA
ncbi:TPA: hypothetical protein N0F65_004621 [Lagenidium giganteum]|uniref:Uncharacterized protein n=1 Tax=Lagenidium giganteum TaxID=4803 RepID=A0AAV2ZDG8_9STRA|nr:TPA: hypothetical protein N0F65_004621 [Lagenidium giganteum]